MGYKFSVFLIVLACVWLQGICETSQQNKIETLVRNHDYSSLENFFIHHKSISLSTLSRIAAATGDLPLMNSVTAANHFNFKKDGFGLTQGKFLACALFFETEAKNYSQSSHYLIPHKTGLANTVELDSHLHGQFIILNSKSAYLAEGQKKIVTRAIQYGLYPKIVARAEQSCKMKRELKITRLMHEKPGLFKTVGFGRHKAHGKTYNAIYSDLYRPGSFQTIFEEGYKFSKKEKMEMALSVVKGLYSLHRKNIVHRDLGARNYLVNIGHGKKDHRDIEATIADLGRADWYKNVSRTKVQGNTTYTSPEGLYRKKMKKGDYLRSDVFAVGCVLYKLFFEEQPKWQDRSYVKDTSRSLFRRYEDMCEKIQYATGKKARLLEIKKNSSILSPYECYEYLILKMVSINPKKRPTAKELVCKMEALAPKNHAKSHK